MGILIWEKNFQKKFFQYVKSHFGELTLTKCEFFVKSAVKPKFGVLKTRRRGRRDFSKNSSKI